MKAMNRNKKSKPTILATTVILALSWSPWVMAQEEEEYEDDVPAVQTVKPDDKRAPLVQSDAAKKEEELQAEKEKTEKDAQALRKVVNGVPLHERPWNVRLAVGGNAGGSSNSGWKNGVTLGVQGRYQIGETPNASDSFTAIQRRTSIEVGSNADVSAYIGGSPTAVRGGGAGDLDAKYKAHWEFSPSTADPFYTEPSNRLKKATLSLAAGVKSDVTYDPQGPRHGATLANGEFQVTALDDLVSLDGNLGVGGGYMFNKGGIAGAVIDVGGRVGTNLSRIFPKAEFLHCGDADSKLCSRVFATYNLRKILSKNGDADIHRLGLEWEHWLNDYSKINVGISGTGIPAQYAGAGAPVVIEAHGQYVIVWDFNQKKLDQMREDEKKRLQKIAAEKTPAEIEAEKAEKEYQEALEKAHKLKDEEESETDDAE